MALARWQGTVLDSSGDVVASATVAVYSETTGALATIYSDRAGTVSITNPTTADSDGFVGFYASGDAYRIVATSGATSREFRYVGIGTNSERDLELVTIAESTQSNVTGVTASGLNLYRKISLEVDYLSSVTDDVELNARVSIDGGSTYVTSSSYTYTLDRRTSTTPALAGSGGTTGFALSISLGTGVGEFYQGVITLQNHTSTATFKYVNAYGSVYDSAPVFRAADFRGLVATGSAITDLQLFASSGNINYKVRLRGELL